MSLRPIPGHPGYLANEQGEIWSTKRAVPRPLTATIDTHGYLQVTLSQGRSNCRAYRVHKLVALTFLGARPEGMETRHLDADRTNARLSNLAYGTSSENNHDIVAHGHHAHANKTHCPRGHEYSPANTGRSKNGRGNWGRYCRACKADRERVARLAAKAVAV